MPGVCRTLVDKIGLGGKVVKGACTVLINGSPAVRVGDLVIPHKPFKGPHKIPSPIVTGVCTVLAEGQPVAVQFTSKAACGDIVLTASCDVQAG